MESQPSLEKREGIFEKVRSIRSVAAVSIQDDEEEFAAVFQHFL